MFLTSGCGESSIGDITADIGDERVFDPSSDFATCRALRRRNSSQSRRLIRAINATPPATPPTIGPTSEDLGLPTISF
jgi:hypothetical protein